MAEMTKTQKDLAIKEGVLQMTGIAELEGVGEIGAFEYAVPIEVAGVTRYCKIKLTAALEKDTKVNKAFNLEDAMAAYQEVLTARAEAEKERAELKAAKARAKAKAKA